MNLDEKCSRHFIWRSLIECGETFQARDIGNLPLEPSSFTALAGLALFVLDAVVDHFGEIQLTFGFCSPELARARRRYAEEHNLLPSIHPQADQHACHEVDERGQKICERGGAAVDFIVPGVSTLEVACWIIDHLPFDRIYYYGPDKPLHVSYNGEHGCRAVTVMRPKKTGRGFVPATLSADKFLERYSNES